MQFSTIASLAAIASVASAASNVTTATATEKTTTLVTITSCEDHVWAETVSPALISTATVTINDIITEYTTWCPIEASESAAENKTKSAVSTAAPVTTTTSIAAHTSVEAKVESTTESESTVTKTVQASKTIKVSSLAVQTVASSTHTVASFTGAANKALPAVGALIAGAAALLI